MKVCLDIPPEMAWLVRYYEKKAEIRGMLEGSSTLEDELLNAIEQYAIAGIQSKPAQDIPNSLND